MSPSSPPPRSPAPPIPEAPEHPAFRRLAVWVLRHRGLVLAGNLLVTLAMGWAIATRLHFDLSTEPFLPKHSHTREVTESFKDDFGHDVYSVVLVEGDIFSLDYLERLRALHEELATLDVYIPSLGKRERTHPPASATDASHTGFYGFGDEDEGWGDETRGGVFEEVVSLINVRQTRGTADGVVVEGLLERWPSAETLPALRERAMGDRSLRGRILATDGRYSALILRTDHMSEQDSVVLDDAMRALTARHEAPGFHVLVAGMPSMISNLTRLTFQDMGRLMFGAVLMMVLVLGVVFRHWLGVVGPIVAVGQSAVWATGLQALLDKPWTQVSSIIPAFLICVGVGDAVHIQSAYRNQLRDGVARHEAIVRAVATTGMPVLFTTLTTFIGLASFQFSEAMAIRDVGLTGAFGVTVAMLQCLLLLPVFLSWHTRGSFGARAQVVRRKDWVDRFLDACDRASGAKGGLGRRRLVLTLGALAAIGCAYEASTVYVSHDDLRHMPADNPAAVAERTANENLGGTGGITVYIRAKPGQTLADRELLLALEQLEQHILAYRDEELGEPLVSNVTSLLDVVREMNRALNGGRPEAYAIPDTQQGVVDMLTLFQQSGPQELARLATIDLTRSHMGVRARWIDAQRYAPFNRHVQRGIARYIGDLAEVELTGTGHLFVQVATMALRDLARSFSIAFVVVTLLLVVMLRSVKLGTLAMLPNLLPIVAVLGVMGACQIWLDYSNVLIASIALGIVVDDTIHFLHQFRAQYEATEDLEVSLTHAFTHSGRAMVITSLTLVAGFSVFALARLGNLRLFGSLVALTVVLALLSDLILAPALLRTFYRAQKRTWPEWKEHSSKKSLYTSAKEST